MQHTHYIKDNLRGTNLSKLFLDDSMSTPQFS